MNWSGIAAAASLVFRPLHPAVSVPDITRLNWAAFRQKGITGVVIDKDNCLTKPRSDVLVPRLGESWDDLLREFGAENVLIVSNSAGTGKDSLLLQAESVSRHLGVPVLVHRHPKPSKKCAKSILTYFSPTSHPKRSFLSRFRRQVEDPGAVVWSRGTVKRESRKDKEVRVLVIGDRLTTDVVLADRLAQLSHPTSPSKYLTAVPILTTSLHAREDVGTTFMRAIESLALRFRKPTFSHDWDSCLHPSPIVKPPPPPLSKRIDLLPILKTLYSAWELPSTVPPRKPFSLARAWGEPYVKLVEGTEKVVHKFDWVSQKARERGAVWNIGAYRSK